VAKAINDKVNKMNSDTGLIIIPVVLFAALDVAQSKGIVLSAVTFAALYFLKGKIPTETD
jgi:hypothetical protein